MIHLIEAVFHETLINVKSKLTAFLIMLLMVSLSFMVFVIFLVVTWNFDSALQKEQENVGIEVFIEDQISEFEGRELQDLISGMEGVRSVYYVSKLEAEAVFRTDLPDQAIMLNLLGSQFHLPASLQISLDKEYRTPERVAGLARTMGGFNGVSDVIYGEDYLPGLSEATDILSKLVLIAGIVLLVSISLVVSNTVRLAIMRRSRTVKIMSVVGAPLWFIRTPFLLEGFIIGFAGAGGSLLITYLVSLSLTPSISHIFLPVNWVFGVLALGAFVGSIGSWIGMRTGMPKLKQSK